MNIRDYFKLNPYTVAKGLNGMTYVLLNTVRKNHVHLSFQNSKTGKVIAFNLPVEYSCDHRCECYSERKCYACHGCYMFSLNQAIYSENLSYFKNHTTAEFIEIICKEISRHKSRKHFRWFTCGDILNTRFLEAMIEIAKRNPSIRFWTYTKKYAIVNSYVKQNGLESIPKNLKIIFSHWMNDDGSYFPMYNPYHFPTSEFIPMGKEEMLETVTHVCPCSNPNVHQNCCNCDHPCYELNFGESMALVEHSTDRTKDRDKAIKKAWESGKKVFNLVSFLKSFVK